MYSISYKNKHNLSVTIMILPKAMHINGIFLNVTKLKVTATRKRKVTKEKQGMIWGDSSRVHFLTSCATEITHISEKWKAGLKQGSAAIQNLFREDIDFLYFKFPEDKNQSLEIKGIGLSITEPIEHNSEYVKQRKSQKRNTSKKKQFTFWVCFLQSHHELNYFMTLLVLLLHSYD